MASDSGSEGGRPSFERHLEQCPHAQPLSRVHFSSLDGIRGLAILLVLLHHYGRSARAAGMDSPVLKISEFGWCGVDLFFVLSGFLITGILFDTRQQDNRFRNFYARRALRIFPLYYVTLALVAVVGTVWVSLDVWGTGNPHWIALYATNIVMAINGPAAGGILGHYWSLAIEEHFYLVWPLFVFARSRRQLIAISSGVLLVALALRTYTVLSGARGDISYFLTPMRIDALAAGALVALAVRGKSDLSALLRPAFHVTTACGLLMLAIILSRRTLSPYDPMMQSVGFTILALGFSALLIIGMACRPVEAILSMRILRWFGKYSYGIYVLHPVVNIMAFHPETRTSLGISGSAATSMYIAVIFCAVLWISVLSYRYLERPFLTLKSHFSAEAGSRAIPGTFAPERGLVGSREALTRTSSVGVDGLK